MPLSKFVVFKNQLLGEEKRATDFNDLLENRMTKAMKNHWSEVKWFDEDGNMIQVSRDFLDQGMTLDQTIQDWKTFGDTTEDIHLINNRGGMVTWENTTI